MALIVEDGTGKLDAESYISVAEFDEYHTKFGNTVPTATVGEKEVACRRATAHMVMTLRGSWDGHRTVYNQALDHPRVELFRDEYDPIPVNQVITEVKAACAEFALIALSGTPLLPTAQNRTKKSVKVGPISVVYDGDGPVGPNFIAALARLAPFLSGAASGHMVSLSRS